MKIVISPSKTMNYQKCEYLEDKEPIYINKHKEVLSKLKKFKKTDIPKVYKIKGDLIDKTYRNIIDYDTNDSYHAFASYTGLVFFNLDRDNYKDKEYEYIASNVRILDAFYGILEPGTLIKPYRLDMKTDIGLNLYQHWNIDDYFNNDVVINLASNEFSKMLNIPMININFLQYKNGKYINQATYSKQARGLFLDYMIKHEIEDISLLKLFNIDTYKFNDLLSDDFNLVFTR
ncbi:YaaA family protein [Candidatus Izemoplasma sp. B36]|uniref:YaaA family protein n=1 Tax=Candidatus Izemoplasma sp. B36 TaxID=3242468 RepID=UPI003556CA36